MFGGTTEIGRQVFENPRQDSEGIAKIYGRAGAAVHLVFGRIGGHIVELIQVLDQPSPAAPLFHVAGSGFTVTVEDAAEARRAAVAAGVEVITELVEVKGTKIFFIRDPDGARIELVEYADGHSVVWPTTTSG